MLRDPWHKMYALWGKRWAYRTHGEAPCFEEDWFSWSADASWTCKRNWGGSVRAPSVFGFSETMSGFCLGERWNENDPTAPCHNAGYNILRMASNEWNMCRNVEWMFCLIQSRAGVGNGEIIFTLAPASLNIDDFNSRSTSYIEDDIYYAEVCVLNEICRNRDDLWGAEIGDRFRCSIDRERWFHLGRAMMAMG